MPPRLPCWTPAPSCCDHHVTIAAGLNPSPRSASGSALAVTWTTPFVTANGGIPRLRSRAPSRRGAPFEQFAENRHRDPSAGRQAGDVVVVRESWDRVDLEHH